jgi:hypothetical protein
MNNDARIRSINRYDDNDDDMDDNDDDIYVYDYCSTITWAPMLAKSMTLWPTIVPNVKCIHTRTTQPSIYIYIYVASAILNLSWQSIVELSHVVSF